MLGEGILKGLAETARNFAGSFVSKERMTTVEYPEERAAAAGGIARFSVPRVRRHRLGEGLRCVACQICEKECPPKCIYIEKSKDKKPDYVGKPQIYPAKFDIDISVCMSCQICVEVCPFEAIKMDTEFELSDRRPVRRAASGSQATCASRTSTTTRFIRRKPPKWMRGWPKRRPRRKPRQGCCRSAQRGQGCRSANRLRQPCSCGTPQLPVSKPPIGIRSRRSPPNREESRKHDRQARPDFCSSRSTGCLAILPAGCRRRCGVMLSVIAIIAVFPALFALTTVLERKGVGRIQNRLGPESRGAIRNSAADGRRHQVADQRRHRSDERGCGGAFPGAGLSGRRRCSWDSPCCPWAATWCWWIWMPACCSISPWAHRRSCRSSWPGGRAATNIRCWARCARLRR